MRSRVELCGEEASIASVTPTTSSPPTPLGLPEALFWDTNLATLDLAKHEK